jgi:predicted secreted protein
MGIAGSLVTIVLLWWLAFFMLLPVGVKSQIEEGEVEPGTVASAPTRPLLLYKALGALAIAITLWLTVFAIIEFRVITFNDLVGKP